MFLKPEYKGRELIANMQPLYPRVPARVLKEASANRGEDSGCGVLDAVRASGVLRVGFLEARPPYSYFNAAGDLVGFDIEMAGLLSNDLGVKLELVPVKFEEMDIIVNRGDVDLLMSGVVVTSRRASSMLFSAPYQEETLAFLVKDHLRDQFSSWDSIRAMGPVRIGTPDLPYFISWLHQRLPEAKLDPIRIDGPQFLSREHVDVMLMSAERGSILTMLFPEYTMVVPEPGTFKVPIAYPMARYDERWRGFVDTWIELQRRNGTIADLYSHWILGKNAEKHKPRWCVIRDVFHWVE
jgi:ABC-type amino acid transport substrate-binding protein